MNKQRQIVYSKRSEIITSSFQVNEYLKSVISRIAKKENLEELRRIFGENFQETLTKKINQTKDEQFSLRAKYVAIAILDSLWKEHLYTIDGLKQEMNLRSYAQKDPFNEYKIAVFEEFQQMLESYEFFLIREVFLNSNEFN